MRITPIWWVSWGLKSAIKIVAGIAKWLDLLIKPLSVSQTGEYGTFHRDLGCAKGAQAGCMWAKVAKFLQVRLSSAQISFAYKFLIFLLQTTANNPWQPCLRKKIAPTIFITYFHCPTAPKCASGSHLKWSRVGLCHTLESGVWAQSRSVIEWEYL